MKTRSMLIHTRHVLRGFAGLVLLFILLVALNSALSSPRLRTRIDLTAENLHTLSDVTRSVLATLKRPVHLRFFFSRSNPAVGSQQHQAAKQVEDIALAYRDAANDQIALTKYDPVPFSEAERLAKSYGVTPILEHPEIPPVYFELVVTSGTAQPERVQIGALLTKGRLEYEITQAIHRLTRGTLPVIGVMSSIPVLGADMPFRPMMPQQPPDQPRRWAIFEEMAADYRFEEIATDTTNLDPQRYPTIMLVHPKELSPSTLYALDQYVLKGGQLVVFVDPYCVNDVASATGGMFGMGGGRSDDLAQLFQAWGVRYAPDRILVDHIAAWQRADQQRGEFVSEPRVLVLPNQFLNQESDLTNRLRVLVMLYAGALSIEQREGITAAPLIASSRESRMISADLAHAPITPENVNDFRPDGISRYIAVELTGAFATAFPGGAPQAASPPDGAPAEAPAEAEAGSHLTTGSGIVMVFADVDMLSDQSSFDTRRDPRTGRESRVAVSSNPELVTAALERAATGTQLYVLSSKGIFTRPFSRIVEMRRKLEEEKLREMKSLDQSVREIETTLNNLLMQRTQQGGMLSSADLEQSIREFEQQREEVQRRRWAINKSFADRINALQLRVKAINIGLVPVLVGIVGIVIGIRRSHRT